jgi:ribosomal protein S18 acetylase RimI-like enzyme
VLVIRSAEPRDADGIAQVCAAGWRDTYQGIDTPERIEAAIAEFYTPERIAGELDARPGWDGWIVAVEDDGVVGAGAGGVTAPGLAEVYVLYLDPGRRGEGIGTLLLDAITERHRAQGAREQWVSVEPENAKGLPFYRARGFEDRGTRPAWGVDAGDGRVSLRLARRIDGD